MCLMMVGCATTFDSKPLDKLPLAIQDPAPLTLDKVTFTVITERNQADVFAEMRKNRGDMGGEGRGEGGPRKQKPAKKAGE